MPVLDTTFCIDLLRGREAAAELNRLLSQSTAPLGVTPHTHYELHFGIGLSQRPEEERQRVDGLLRELFCFAFDPEVARTAGRLAARARQGGQPMPLIDLFIAATALAHGEPVVTRDRGPFDRVAGLEVLSY